MTNNQEWFNNNYPKENKEIKFRFKKFAEQQLMIGDYSKLEILQLLKVNSIRKLVLRNLDKLQECTIQGCGTAELIIENCPQIKKLNLRSNLLTNLEFLKSLPNLEELELDGNIEIKFEPEHLPKSLKNFSLIELLFEQKSQKLLKNVQKLEGEINKLKQNQSTTIDNPTDFEKKYQKLKGVLNFLIKEEELKSKEIDKLVTDDILENVKALKEDLSKTQKIKKELEEKLALYETVWDKIEQKEKELEELKASVIINKPEIKDDLEELLEAQTDNNNKWLERVKKRLIKHITTEQIDLLCQKQEIIIQLQRNINQREKQIYQIIINGGYNINHFESAFYDSSSGGTIANQQETESLISQAVVFPQK